jgi:hypothetical protein
MSAIIKQMLENLGLENENFTLRASNANLKAEVAKLRPDCEALRAEHAALMAEKRADRLVMATSPELPAALGAPQAESGPMHGTDALNTGGKEAIGELMRYDADLFPSTRPISHAPYNTQVMPLIWAIALIRGKARITYGIRISRSSPFLIFIS